MDFTLNEDQALLKSSAQDFLRAEWASAEMRRMLGDGAPAAASAFWSKIVELGWPALLIPEDHEGLGSGVFDLAVLMEELGRRLVPGELLSCGVLSVAALRHLAGEEARKELLPKIALGEIRAGFSLAGAPERLKYAPGLAGADVLLTAVVEPDDSVALYAGNESSVQTLKSLDPTRPLATAQAGNRLLGRGSRADLDAALDVATVALAAEMTGGVAELLDMTIAYVKQRKQFSVPVGVFQAVQHRAANIYEHLEKARSAVQYAALVADEAPADLPMAASMAKVAANQAFVFAAEQAIQLHGGIGFTWEQDLHIYLKRAKSSEVLLGNTGFHLDRIAGGLGV